MGDCLPTYKGKRFNDISEIVDVVRSERKEVKSTDTETVAASDTGSLVKVPAPDIVRPSEELNMFDIKSDSYKEITAYSEYIKDNPDQANDFILSQFGAKAGDDPKKVIQDNVDVKEKGFKNALDGDIAVFTDPQGEMASYGVISIDDTNHKQYYTYYNPNTKKQSVISLDQAEKAFGEGYVGASKNAQPSNLNLRYVSPEDWALYSGKHGELKSRFMDMTKHMSQDEIVAHDQKVQQLKDDGVAYDPDRVSTYVPKDKPYWFKSGFNSSIIGKAYQMLNWHNIKAHLFGSLEGGSKWDEESKSFQYNTAKTVKPPYFDLGDYKPEFAEEVVAGAFGILLDTPEFALYGNFGKGMGEQVGSKAIEILTKKNIINYGSKAVEDLMAKGWPEALATKTVNAGLVKVLDKAKAVGGRFGSSMAALGIYDYANDVATQVTSDGGNWGDVKYAQSLKEGAIGATLGFGLGWVGMGSEYLNKLLTNPQMSSVERNAIKVGVGAISLPVEAGVFVYGKQGLQGKPLFGDEGVTARDYGQMVGTLLVLKGQHAAGKLFSMAKGHDGTKVNKGKYQVKFTNEELEYLNKKYPYGNNTNEVIFNLVKTAGKIDPETKRISSLQISDLMADPQVPMSLKDKLIWTLGGYKRDFDYNATEVNLRQDNNRYYVELKNANKDLIEVTSTRDVNEANAQVQKLTFSIIDNQKQNQFAGFSEMEKGMILHTLKGKGMDLDLLHEAWQTNINSRTPDQQKMMESLFTETESVVEQKQKAADKAVKEAETKAKEENKLESVKTAAKEKTVTVNIPIDQIEHGESALPGGKLTLPGAHDLIKKYAEMPTEFPPIQVFASEDFEGKPTWMVEDGSHRLEAAKLRGDKTIKAEVNVNDENVKLLEQLKIKEKPIESSDISDEVQRLGETIKGLSEYKKAVEEGEKNLKTENWQLSKKEYQDKIYSEKDEDVEVGEIASFIGEDIGQADAYLVKEEGGYALERYDGSIIKNPNRKSGLFISHQLAWDYYRYTELTLAFEKGEKLSKRNLNELIKLHETFYTKIDISDAKNNKKVTEEPTDAENVRGDQRRLSSEGKVAEESKGDRSPDIQQMGEGTRKAGDESGNPEEGKKSQSKTEKVEQSPEAQKWVNEFTDTKGKHIGEKTIAQMTEEGSISKNDNVRIKVRINTKNKSQMPSRLEDQHFTSGYVEGWVDKTPEWDKFLWDNKKEAKIVGGGDSKRKEDIDYYREKIKKGLELGVKIPDEVLKDYDLYKDLTDQIYDLHQHAGNQRWVKIDEIIHKTDDVEKLKRLLVGNAALPKPILSHFLDDKTVEQNIYARIQYLQMHPEKQVETGNPKVSIHERPSGENPIKKVEYKGKTVYIQRSYNQNNVNEWNVVLKDGKYWKDDEARKHAAWTQEEIVKQIKDDIDAEELQPESVKPEAKKEAKPEKLDEHPDVIAAEVLSQDKWQKAGNKIGVESAKQLVANKDKKLNDSLSEELELNGYVKQKELPGNEIEWEITPKGRELISAIEARQETIKGLNEGWDIFPADADVDLIRENQKKVEDVKLFRTPLKKLGDESAVTDQIGVDVSAREFRRGNKVVGITNQFVPNGDYEFLSSNDSQGFAGEFVAPDGEKIDQTKPFYAIYFGDYEAGIGYERATISNDLQKAISIAQRFDTQSGLLEVYDPETKLVDAIEIFPFANQYTPESVRENIEWEKTNREKRKTEEEAENAVEEEKKANAITKERQDFENSVEPDATRPDPIEVVKEETKADLPDEVYTQRMKDYEDFVDKTGFAIRTGDFDTMLGGYVATPGMSTYYDPYSTNKDAHYYDISHAEIVESDTPQARQLLSEILKEPDLDETLRKKIQDALDNDSHIDYKLLDENYIIKKTAARMGYDGIKVWENDDAGNPSSIYIMNRHAIDHIGAVKDIRDGFVQGKGWKDTRVADIPEGEILKYEPKKKSAPKKKEFKPLDDKGQKKIIKKLANGKNSLPICNDVMVENGVMTSTDLDVTIKVKTSLPDGIYRFVGDDLVPHKNDKGEMLSRDEFPQDPEMKKITHKFELNGMSDAIRLPLPFTGSDDLRPVMSGVNLRSDGKKLTIMATDAHVCYVKHIPVKLPEFDIIVPKKVISFMMANPTNDNFKVELSENNISVKTPDMEIIGRLEDGKYPDVPSVTPEKVQQQYTLDREELIKAIDKIMPYANRSTHHLKIYFDTKTGEITLHAEDIDQNIEKSIKLQNTKIKVGEADFKETKESGNYRLLMPVMIGDEANNVFGVNGEFLKKLAESFPNDEIVFHNTLKPSSTSYNRAFLMTDHELSVKVKPVKAEVKEEPKAETQNKPRTATNPSKRYNALFANEGDISTTAGAGGGKKEAGETPKAKVTMEDFDIEIPEHWAKVTAPDVVFRSIDFPEMVEIVKKMMGRYPQPRNMRKPGLLGYFRHGGGKEPMIALKKALFEEANYPILKYVLAHEVGHLNDWMPDEDMKHGNILGRISNGRGYLKSTLGEKPGKTDIITPEDRDKFKKEARRILKEEKAKGDREIIEEVTKEIPVFDEAGLSTDDILAIWKDINAREKFPDLYDYIASLPTDRMKAIVRDAARRLMNSEIAKKFKKQIGTTTITEKTIRMVRTPDVTPEMIKKMYKKLLMDEINKRRLFDKETITKELMDVTSAWRRYDPATASKDEKAYRESPEELYADAFSMLINDPERLAKMAPVFYQAYFNWWDAKSSTKAYFDEIQDMLRGKGNILDAENTEAALEQRRLDRIVNGYKEAEEKRTAIANEKHKSSLSWWGHFKREFISKRSPLFSLIKFEKGKHLTMEFDTEQRIDNATQLLAYTRDQVGELLTDINTMIEKPLADAGLSPYDFGALLEMERNMTQYKDKARPLGFQMDASKSIRDYIFRKYTPEQQDILKQIVQDFHDKVYEVMDYAHQNGIFTEDQWNNVIEQNKDVYATYSKVKYIFENYISSRIMEAEGSLENNENPLVATVFKMSSTFKLAKRNRAALEVVKDILATAPDEITIKSVRRGKGGVDLGFEKPEVGKDHIVYFENGVKKAAEVDKYIADVFNNPDSRHMLTSVREVFHKYNYVFKPLVTSLNVGWAFYNNPIRDARRSMRNLFTILHSTIGVPKRKAYGVVPRFLAAYSKQVWYKNSEAKNYVRNVLDPAIREMIDNGAISRGFFGSYDPFVSQQLEPAFKQHGFVGKEKTTMEKIKDYNAMTKGVAYLVDRMLFGASVMEAIPKIVSYDILKTELKNEALAAYHVRNYIGTPFYYEKGTQTYLTNEILPFSNVIIQGIKADLHLATSPQTRKAYAIYQTINSGSIALVSAGAAMGLFGDKVKKCYDKIDDYYKFNYYVIPFGLTEKGRPIFATLPLDEFGRMYYAAVYGAAMTMYKGYQGNLGDFDAVWQQFRNVGAIGTGMIPTISPLVSIIDGISSFMAGQNFKDSRTGQDVIPPKPFGAGMKESAPYVLKWAIKKSGGNYMVSMFERQKATDNWIEYSLKNTPLLSRFIRIGGTGEYQIYKQTSQNVSRDRFRDVIKMDDIVNDAVIDANEKQLDESASYEYNDKFMEDYFGKDGYDAANEQNLRDLKGMHEKFRIRMLRGYNTPTDQLVSGIIDNGASKDQQIAILKRGKEFFTAQEYNDIIFNLRVNKIISDDVYNEVFNDANPQEYKDMKELFDKMK
jgi:predicted transcriptional regulator